MYTKWTLPRTRISVGLIGWEISSAANKIKNAVEKQNDALERIAEALEERLVDQGIDGTE